MWHALALISQHKDSDIATWRAWGYLALTVVVAAPDQWVDWESYESRRPTVPAPATAEARRPGFV